MNQEEILEIMESTGAVQKGHFVLSSGLHSDTYYQCAKVFEHPGLTEKLGDEITRFWEGHHIDVVVSPALGGIVLGFSVALSMGARFLFTERDNKKMSLRRGFEIKGNERLLVVEDVVTTGGSVREVIEIIREKNAHVVGLSCLLNRGDKKEIAGVQVHSLVSASDKTYKPEECPLEKQGLPVVSPGSRRL